MRWLLPAFAVIRGPAHQHGGAAAAERGGGGGRIDREVEEERRAVVGVRDPGVGRADERPTGAFRHARGNRVTPIVEVVGSGKHADPAARGTVIPPILLMPHQDPFQIRRIHRDRRFDRGVWVKRGSETRLLARDVVTLAIGERVAGGHLHQWTDAQLIGERAGHHQCTRQGGQADEGVSKVETGSTILHLALRFAGFLTRIRSCSNVLRGWCAWSASRDPGAMARTRARAWPQCYVKGGSKTDMLFKRDRKMTCNLVALEHASIGSISQSHRKCAIPRALDVLLTVSLRQRRE